MKNRILLIATILFTTATIGSAQQMPEKTENKTETTSKQEANVSTAFLSQQQANEARELISEVHQLMETRNQNLKLKEETAQVSIADTLKAAKEQLEIETPEE